MRFVILTDRGGQAGPFGSLVIARKEAQGIIAGNKSIKRIELRPLSSKFFGQPYGKAHSGSFYEVRR